MTQWSIVIDMKQGRVYFRTSIGGKIKYFDMSRFDLSPDTPVKMLDINANLKGDVFDYFVDYSPRRNLRAAKEGIESTDSYEQGLSKSLEQYGYDLGDLVDRVCTVANGESCGSSLVDIDSSENTDDIAEDALSKPNQNDNWILLLVLGISLALLISMSLFLFYRKRRRRSAK